MKGGPKRAWRSGKQFSIEGCSYGSRRSYLQSCTTQRNLSNVIRAIIPSSPRPRPEPTPNGTK